MTDDPAPPRSDGPGSAPAPLLSVVVIVYNDAARLPAAVASVRAQTVTDLEVIIVDDASTDGSAAVADHLAAGDRRARVVHLPQNSGGCSRPRNTGIDHARGRYVMFLDSDDVLPPDAGRRLVDAAEGSGADFSSGRCVRVHLSQGGRVRQWYRWLYNEPAYYASVLENPDLLYDTLSTNKCYRRDFLNAHGLRFPDGYHYEDLLFSARAYAAARGIAIIPEVVYHWNVIDDADTPSISNRRSELRNFEDRIRILELIDEEFASRDAGELKLAKDVKFLRHDLRLYLADFPFRPDGYRSRFLAVAKGYLRTLDPRAFERAEPVQAIAAWLILQDDEANLCSAIDYICHGHKLSTRLVRRNGRVYWCADHLDTAEGRAVLDVTELGFGDQPVANLDLYNRLTEVVVEGTRLALAGEVINQLGRVPADRPLGLRLVMRARRRRRRHGVDVTEWSHDGDVIRWRVEVDLRQLHAVGMIDRVWDARLLLRVGDEVNDTRVSAQDPTWNGLSLPVRPLLGRLAADSLETLITPDGDLALEFVPGTPLARSLQRRGQRAAHSSGARRLKALTRRARALARNPRHPRLLAAVFRQTLLRLPRRTGLVVFESAGGARCTGNPRAIYAELRRQGFSGDVVWAHTGRTEEFPTDARLVRHGSLAYYAALACAAVWVDDRGFPREAVKRTGTFYLQTWSGTPVRRVGFESRAMRRPSGGRAALRAQVARWDGVLARAPYDAEVLTRALRVRAPVLPFGYPRNDALVTGGDDVAKTALRERLGVPRGQEVVLHLPACRAAVVSPTPEDLAPGQTLVVRRPASWPAVRMPAGVVDATGVDDLTTLLLIADVLVTDHHPALFEMPLSGRPVVLLGCRCRLRSSRGDRDAYLDLGAEAPGPTVSDNAELAAELGDLAGVLRRHRQSMERVVKEYGAYDTGRAAASVVELLLPHLDAAGAGS